jgi:hypothetical protein
MAVGKASIEEEFRTEGSGLTVKQAVEYVIGVRA